MNTILLDPHLFDLVRLESHSDSITAVLISTQLSSCCPLCHQPSTRIQSRYTRSLQDLPWQGITLRITLHTRRFFCDVLTCSQSIFTERFPGEVTPYARRTQRLDHWLKRVTLALGGEAGARLLHDLGIHTSPDILLRHLQTLLPSPSPAPTVVGIDEFAFRRGRRFATIIVDLHTHHVLDLLPDRTKETLTRWLTEHPTVTIVSRDRASGFGEMIRAVAPQIIQIADRFHLLQNLTDRLELFWRAHKALLKTPRGDLLDTHPELRGRTSRMNAVSYAAHEQNLTLYRQVKEGQARGLNQTALSHLLQIGRKTARRYMEMTQPPDPRRNRSGTPLLIMPHVSYIVQRWNEGCRNAQQIWRELQERGYAQSARTVSRFLTLLRLEGGIPWKFQSALPAPYYDPTTSPPLTLSAKQAARLCQRRPDALTSQEHQRLIDLCAAHDEIARMYAQVQAFGEMVRTRGGERLDAWLSDVQERGCSFLQDFARSVKRDEEAVRAGLTQPWSQGMVEGHVNRIKLIKRSGYDRMSFSTLRQRVLIQSES